MEKRELKILYLDISEIKEYENNAKEHPEWQIKQIAKSVQEFGFNDPIAVDEDMMIIEGHGRLLAGKLLGMEKVPCIKLVGLTETQKRAYIIAHNKLTLNTDLDLEKLEYELNALKVDGLNLELAGFNELELQELLDENDLFCNYGFSEEKLENEYKEPSKKIICPHCKYQGKLSEFEKEE